MTDDDEDGSVGEYCLLCTCHRQKDANIVNQAPTRLASNIHLSQDAQDAQDVKKKILDLRGSDFPRKKQRKKMSIRDFLASNQRESSDVDHLFSFVLKEKKGHLQCCIKKLHLKFEMLHYCCEKLKEHVARCMQHAQELTEKLQATGKDVIEKKLILLQIEIAEHVAKLECLKGKKILIKNHLQQLISIEDSIKKNKNPNP